MHEGLDVLASCIRPSIEPCINVFNEANPSADFIFIVVLEQKSGDTTTVE